MTDKELPESEVSERIATRRAKREAQRLTVRSAALRRKTDEESAPSKKKAPAAKKKKSAKPSMAKPSAKKPTAAKKPAKKKTATAKSKARPAKAKKPTEEYELRSQPDGTLRRVKIEDKASKPIIMRRRSSGKDTGPGPAIVDLASVGAGLWNRERVETTEPEIAGSMPGEVEDSVKFLKRKIAKKPKVAVILGSGLSEVAELVDEKRIEFSDIPGFAVPKASGHPGYISFGSFEGTPVLFSAGRSHYYETGSMKETVHAVRTFLAMGVERLILTTSAGAINPSFKEGNIMFVEDHINLMGDNPLFGLDPQAEPSIFVDVSNVYDKKTLEISDRICRRARLRPQSGVLAAVRGPVYETPTELNWLKSTGADAVCMSLVPEALEAARYGVPVTGIAVITNAVSPKRKKPLSHQDVATAGERYAARLKRLISYLLAT